MMSELDRDAHAAHIAAVDGSGAVEALGRIGGVLPGQLAEDPVPVIVESDRVDVDLPPLLVAEDEIGVELATDVAEAMLCEGVEQAWDVGDADDQVEVLVWSCLALQQGVEVPAAFDPGLDA